MSQAEILYRFIQQIVQQDIPEVKHVNLFHAQNTNPAQTLRYPVPAVLLQLQPTTANKLEELFYNELMPFSIHLVMNNIAETSTDSEVESLSLLQKVKKQLLISQLPDFFVDLRYQIGR
ncbi:MAG TPA: hypothetical protein DCM08_12645, partial [Microscillaceae bacterium]|nr:hypothetical protein [Microscillaceae bacterium]